MGMNNTTAAYQIHVLRCLLNYHERMMMDHSKCPGGHCIHHIDSPYILAFSDVLERLSKRLGTDMLKGIYRLQVVPSELLNSVQDLRRQFPLATDFLNLTHDSTGTNRNASILFVLE